MCWTAPLRPVYLTVSAVLAASAAPAGMIKREVSMRMRIAATALVGIAVWAHAAAAVVQLKADSVTVAAAGELAEVCVRLDSGGQEVAGTENRVVWDGSCISGPSGA